MEFGYESQQISLCARSRVTRYYPSGDAFASASDDATVSRGRPASVIFLDHVIFFCSDHSFLSKCNYSEE